MKSLEWSLKGLDSRNKQGAQKASIWEIKGDIFVSSEIHQIKGNYLHISVTCIKWSEIDTYYCGNHCKCKVSLKFFPAESVNSHERIMLS